MPDFNRIFRDSTALYDQSGIFAGVGGIESWRDVFSTMRTRLDTDGATAEEKQTFKDAILRAIDAASELDLKDDERTALRAVLLKAFDGTSQPYKSEVAPKAQFLRHVSF